VRSSALLPKPMVVLCDPVPFFQHKKVAGLGQRWLGLGKGGWAWAKVAGLGQRWLGLGKVIVRSSALHPTKKMALGAGKGIGHDPLPYFKTDGEPGNGIR
jgi:hypothetical protein